MGNVIRISTLVSFSLSELALRAMGHQTDPAFLWIAALVIFLLTDWGERKATEDGFHFVA